jgi:hypothetical protein
MPLTKLVYKYLNRDRGRKGIKGLRDEDKKKTLFTVEF